MQKEIRKKVLSSIEKKKKDIPFELLGRSLSANPFSPRDIRAFLTPTKDQPFKVIAEIKDFDTKNFNFLEVAQKYFLNGANAICVSTKSDYFECKVDYLSQIRRYVPIPIIQEEFILDKYQIMESLVYGADAIFLNARLLDKKELKYLYEYTLHLGLEAIIQVYNKEDLKKAIKCGANIIGLYDKDLETSTIDNNIFESLISMIPNKKIILAKCDIITSKKLQYLNSIGIDIFFNNSLILNN